MTHSKYMRASLTFNGFNGAVGVGTGAVEVDPSLELRFTVPSFVDIVCKLISRRCFTLWPLSSTTLTAHTQTRRRRHTHANTQTNARCWLRSKTEELEIKNSSRRPTKELFDTSSDVDDGWLPRVDYTAQRFNRIHRCATICRLI